MSNVGKTSKTFDRLSLGTLRGIPSKACLIFPHFICQKCWVDLYLVHDKVVPYIASTAMPALVELLVGVGENLIRLGFYKRDNW